MNAHKFINPLTIALAYLFAGALWIAFSDRWVAGITEDPELLSTLQTYKGWFYVTVTAIPLYILITIHQKFVLSAANLLRKTEKRYEELFLSTPYPITVVGNVDYRIVAHNLIFRSVLGFNESDKLEELSFSQLVKRSDLEDFERYLHANSYGTPEVFTFMKKNGSPMSMEVSCNAIQFDGKPAILVQFRDVTAELINREQVRRLTEHLESTVEQRTRKLNAINEELEAFTYSVSHDLKAPLRAISGFSEELHKMEGDSIKDTAIMYVNRIRTAAARMHALIEDLLRLSRISSAELSITPVDLRKMVGEIIATYDREVIHLKIDTSLTVYADEQLLRIAMENLIANAVKFSSRQEHPEVIIGSNNTEGGLEFYVKDNGIGIDLTRAEHLFRPFHRLVRDDEFPGYGIGLALTRRIIYRHDGRIRISSKPGMGATFYFSLGIRPPHLPNIV